MRPSPALLEAAARLGWVADFLVVTSNFPHLFEAQLAKAAGVPLLSMVELVLAEVEHRGWRCVGALGFGDPVVYTERLRQRGLGVSTASSRTRRDLDRAINAVLEGRADDEATRIAPAAVAELRSAGADGVIAGCTEIPLLLGNDVDAADIVNPRPLLAEAAAARACSPYNTAAASKSLMPREASPSRERAWLRNIRPSTKRSITSPAVDTGPPQARPGLVPHVAASSNRLCLLGAVAALSAPRPRISWPARGHGYAIWQM